MSWSSLRSLNFTSRLWGSQAVISREALKKVLNLCGKYVKVWDMSEESVVKPEAIFELQHCPNLISVDFRSIFVQEDFIISLVHNCKSITILKLGHLSPAASEWFANGKILSTYTNLQVLGIHGCYSFNYFGDWIKFKNKDLIKELRLEFCLGLGQSNLSSVVPQLPNLHTLSLRGSLLENYAFDLDFIELSNIQELDISCNCSIVLDNYLIRNARAFACLKSLSINSISSISRNCYVNDRGLVQIVTLSNLEYLAIDELCVQGWSLLNLPHLKELSCRGCPNLDVKHMESLFSTSDRLEFIDLRGIEKINLIYKIMAVAMKSMKSRQNGIELHMYVDSAIGGFRDGLLTVTNHR